MNGSAGHDDDDGGGSGGGGAVGELLFPPSFTRFLVGGHFSKKSLLIDFHQPRGTRRLLQNIYLYV